MNRKTVRANFFAAIISLLLFAIPAMADQASIMVKPGTLQEVLDAYSKTTGTKIVYLNELVEGKKSPGTQNASPGNALQQILQGTGLTFEVAGNNTVVLKKKNPAEKQPIPEQKKNKIQKPTIRQARREMNLEALTVSAQKTEEKVQDVPISMTVFDALSIEDRHMKSIKDIAAYTPNLMLHDVGNGAGFCPTIRGLRTDSGADSSSLGLYIDGVPMLGSGIDAMFMDIERIEVLKGPQSTLYGKGTEAGVINIISRKPDNETKAVIGAEFGSDSKNEYSFSASSPLVKDKLYIGLSGRYYEKDGLIKNTYKGGQTDDREYNYGKINLRYTPADTLDISLISQILKRKDGGVSWNPVSAPARENTSDVGISEPEIFLNALKVKYDYDHYKFESITTYKYYDSDALLRDFDFSSDVVYHSGDDSNSKTYAQEFRVSAKSDRLNWLIGINADKEKKETSHFTESIYPSYVSEYKSDYEADSYGVFVHAAYLLSHNLSLIGGLRYDKNNIDCKEKGVDETINNTFSEVSPKMGLEYNLNKDSMIYTTVAKGYKPGGIYVYAHTGYPKTYDKETLWSYEIGSKNSFFDNTLVLNAAVYYMAVDNMQVTTFIHDSGSGNSFEYKSNAAEATSKGFEFDVKYRATGNLEFFTSFGYNDTEFDEYKDSKGDFSGNTNPLAPKYNYNIGVQYRADRGYYARVDINGYGDMYLNRENKYKREAYNLVDTRIGYETEKYDIYLYADNLFDKEYDSDGIYNGAYVIYSEPREIGIQLTYRF